ncbi:hypothetical protein LZ30DRAFT_706337 [Colletotrichum cereale]|nr:hypothetical protein LZ30DRAFT_706337 [Colletotrichum cereale]
MRKTRNLVPSGASVRIRPTSITFCLTTLVSNAIFLVVLFHHGLKPRSPPMDKATSSQLRLGSCMEARAYRATACGGHAGSACHGRRFGDPKFFSGWTPPPPPGGFYASGSGATETRGLFELNSRRDGRPAASILRRLEGERTSQHQQPDSTSPRSILNASVSHCGCRNIGLHIFFRAGEPAKDLLGKRGPG